MLNFPFFRSKNRVAPTPIINVQPQETPNTPLARTDSKLTSTALSATNLNPVAIITPKKLDDHTEISSSTSSEDSPPPPVRKALMVKIPRMMPEIRTLHLISDNFFYLDQVKADSLEDERLYQHNKDVILKMIAHDKEVIHLPEEKALSEYIEKIKRYDENIIEERTRFNPQLKRLNKSMPKFEGKKSEQLAYLYLEYLKCYAKKNQSKNSPTHKIDQIRWFKITESWSMFNALKDKVQLSVTSEAIINMRAAVKLRKERLIELYAPPGSLDMEKHLATLSPEAKETWLRETTETLLRLSRECEQEILADRNKFPGETAEILEAYRSDLLYSRAPDYYLVVVRDNAQKKMLQANVSVEKDHDQPRQEENNKVNSESKTDEIKKDHDSHLQKENEETNSESESEEINSQFDDEASENSEQSSEESSSELEEDNDNQSENSNSSVETVVYDDEEEEVRTPTRTYSPSF